MCRCDATIVCTEACRVENNEGKQREYKVVLVHRYHIRQGSMHQEASSGNPVLTWTYRPCMPIALAPAGNTRHKQHTYSHSDTPHGAHQPWRPGHTHGGEQKKIQRQRSLGGLPAAATTTGASEWTCSGCVALLTPCCVSSPRLSNVPWCMRCPDIHAV